MYFLIYKFNFVCTALFWMFFSPRRFTSLLHLPFQIYTNINGGGNKNTKTITCHPTISHLSSNLSPCSFTPLLSVQTNSWYAIFARASLHVHGIVFCCTLIKNEIKTWSLSLSSCVDSCHVFFFYQNNLACIKMFISVLLEGVSYLFYHI